MKAKSWDGKIRRQYAEHTSTSKHAKGDRGMILGGDVERFAAPTRVYYVRVLEDELGAHSILMPVHLTPDNGEEGFAIYEHFDALLLYDLVELSRLLHVF